MIPRTPPHRWNSTDIALAARHRARRETEPRRDGSAPAGTGDRFDDAIDTSSALPRRLACLLRIVTAALAVCLAGAVALIAWPLLSAALESVR